MLPQKFGKLKTQKQKLNIYKKYHHFILEFKLQFRTQMKSSFCFHVYELSRQQNHSDKIIQAMKKDATSHPIKPGTEAVRI